MQDNMKMMETLVEKTIDYSKTSYEVIRLKSLDKASDVLSTIIPHASVLILVASFLLLFNFGLAFWLGDFMGNMAYGFFTVAAFYALISLLVHFFMHKHLKMRLRNYFIKHMFN